MASESITTKKDEASTEETPKYLTLEEIIKESAWRLKMQVKTPQDVFAYCYLDTHNMSVSYTPNTAKGNLSFQWLFTLGGPMEGNSTSYISNVVIEKTGEYLNLVKAENGYRLAVCKENPNTLFILEEIPNNQIEFYIYAEEESTRYYLTPTDDGRVLAQSGQQKYGFKFFLPPH